MSKGSRYGLRYRWAMACVALVTLPNSLAAQEGNARLATFESATGEISFALSLQPEIAPQGEVQPGHVVILVDTSASQIGLFRDDSLKVLKSVLQGLDPADQFRLFAVDLDSVAMTDGFIGPQGSDVEVGLEKLAERLPLGSTDMAEMLRSLPDSFAGVAGKKDVIYIGDGISRGAGIAPERLQALLKNLVDNQISVSSFAIGPERDVEFLATLANRTGGNVFVDTDEVNSTDEAAAGLVTTVRGTVFWPNRMETGKSVAEIFPAIAPPLRSDRDSILVGSLSDREPVSITLHGEINGAAEQYTWTAAPEASDGEFRFLPDLVGNARGDRGMSLPTVGSPGLREAARMILATSQQITQLGSAVLASARTGETREDANAPASPPAGEQEQSPGSAPQPQEGLVLGNPPVSNESLPSGTGGLNLVDQEFNQDGFQQEVQGSSEFLDSEKARRQAGEKRLEAYVNNEMRISREYLSTNPDLGIDRLKAMLDTVERAPDVDPALRDDLRRRLTSALRSATAQKQDFDTRVALANESRANAESRLSLLNTLQDREEKVSQLINQFNSLLEERNFDGALETVKSAVDLNPRSPDTTAAEEISIMETNWELYWELRNRKNRNFLANLYEVEKSAVPFSGNPPLVFPDADEWIEKKLRRQKWQNIAFPVEGGKNTEAILAALQKEAGADYFDERFGDILDELRENYAIQIELHESAIDNNLDLDTLITKKLSGISLRSLLRIILDAYECTYIIKNEVLMIVSDDFAVENPVTYIYNVGDLVAPRNVQGGLGGGQGGGGLGGGQGGGGFGGGGGGLGQGGGVFCIQDAPALNSKPPGKPQVLAVKVAEGEDLRQAWNRYFATWLAAPEDVRETALALMKERRTDEIVAMLEGCIRNGQAKGWMYESIMVAMQISGSPQEEIERTVMSAIDYSDDTEDLLNAAIFMTKNGMEKRALKVLKYVTETNPVRHEPYAIAIRAARAIGDTEAMKWAVLGAISQEWPEYPQERKNAFAAAKELQVDLQKSGKLDDLKQFNADLEDALARDVVIVVTWTGEADLDLFVEEPGGSICSREMRRSQSGGIFMGDNSSRTNEPGSVSEYYIAPRGFAGDYRLAIRRVWGDVPTGKVTVEIYRNYRAANQTSMKRQVALDDKGAVVYFALDAGRRKEKLDPRATQVAQATTFVVDREELAERLNSYQWSSASRKFRGQNPEGAAARERARQPLDQESGFRPEIETFQVGRGVFGLTATTADRLYVIVSSPGQLFSDITSVSTFNFVTGDTGAGGAGGAGAGGAGAGGPGGGAGT